MKAQSTILIVDHDSELATILGSYFSTQGCRIQFTTRVNEAIKKIENQKFAHILVDPNLKPDNYERILNELTSGKGMNVKTPLTIMTWEPDFTVPLLAVRRIHSILIKPFKLAEVSYRVLSQGSKSGAAT